MGQKILSHRDLLVYQRAFETASEIFEISRKFPREEVYSLTDQIRRSSRSVCANLAEAWRKRRYEGAFIAKLSDAEAEAAETQFAVKCRYLLPKTAYPLNEAYEKIIGTLVGMINNPHSWVFPSGQK